MISIRNECFIRINKNCQKSCTNEIIEYDKDQKSQKVLKDKVKSTSDLSSMKNKSPIYMNNQKNYVNNIVEKNHHNCANHQNIIFQTKYYQSSIHIKNNINNTNLSILPKEFFIINNQNYQNCQNKNNQFSLKSSKNQNSQEFYKINHENDITHIKSHSKETFQNQNIYKQNNKKDVQSINQNINQKQKYIQDTLLLNNSQSITQIKSNLNQINKNDFKINHNQIQNKVPINTDGLNDYFKASIQKSLCISNINCVNFGQQNYNNSYMKNEIIQNTAILPAVTPNKSDNYIIQTVAGSGTFGIVYISKQIVTGEKVAHKKVFQDKRYKNRELQILQKLNHPNIVKLRDSYITNEKNDQYLNIIMDYYPQTLGEFINRENLNSLMIKQITYQIFQALQYLSSLNIAHRDIKPHNILIDRIKNHVAICDFGSSKKLNKGEKNLAYICSRSFRATQLIFGATDYTTQVDVWAAGCIIVQMIKGRLPFVASSQNSLLTQIIKVLGTPSEQDALQMNSQYDRSFFNRLPKKNPQSWQNVLKTNDSLLIDLVSKILVYSPKKRLTPTEALNHPYFDEIKNLSDSKKIYRSLSLPEELKQVKDEQNTHINISIKNQNKINLHGCMLQSPIKKKIRQYLSNSNLKLNKQNSTNLKSKNFRPYNSNHLKNKEEIQKVKDQLQKDKPKLKNIFVTQTQ